jgi:hypothetical protein
VVPHGQLLVALRFGVMTLHLAQPGRKP